MARFKASRFARSARVAKVAKPATETEESAEPEEAAAPMARMVRPTRTSRIAEEPVEEASAPSPSLARRVDPADSLRRATAQTPDTMREKVNTGTVDKDTDTNDSRLIDEKRDSRSTAPGDEHTQGNFDDPGRAGPTESGDMGRAASQYTGADFTSRAESVGYGSFERSTSSGDVAGASQIPTGGPAQSGSDTDEQGIHDPSNMGTRVPPMPAGFDASPSNLQAGNLRGLTEDADAYGSNSAADSAGLAPSSASGSRATGSYGQGSGTTGSGSGSDGSSPDDSGVPGSDQPTDDLGPTFGWKPDGAGKDSGGGSKDSATAGEGSATSSEDAKNYLDASGATTYLEDEGYDVSKMSEDEVKAALSDAADKVIAIDPGKAYLKDTGRGYDVENMSNQEIVDALNSEAEYELKGGDGSGAVAPTPAYVDADSGGEESAQVAADGDALGAQTSATSGGDVDPVGYGMDTDGESADTSILDVSDPSAGDAGNFGGGSGSAPPPSAGPDFGPDHVDSNPGTGPTDDIGGIGLGHDDGTIDVDFGTDSGDMLMPQASTEAGDAANEVGFAVDLGEVVDDALVDDPGDDPDGFSRITDMFN